MKNCPKCHAEIADGVSFCPDCGAPVNENQAAYDPYDHTSEFDAKDISDNKVVAMMPYILGVLGLIVAILLANTSKFVQFHIRTVLKFTVIEFLCAVCCIVPILGWIVGGAGIAICFVLRIIAFVQICMGKAKDPVIIRSLNFLK